MRPAVGARERQLHEPAGARVRPRPRVPPRVARHDRGDGELGARQQQPRADRHQQPAVRSLPGPAERVPHPRPDVRLLVRQRPAERGELRVPQPQLARLGRADRLELQPGRSGRDVDADRLDRRLDPGERGLNWTDPTYVCTDTGIRGVGGTNGPNSQLWSALADLEGEIRDFPINWEGPGAPFAGAPPQGIVYQQGNIDKYDIIGFAFLRSSTSSPSTRRRAASGSAKTKNNRPGRVDERRPDARTSTRSPTRTRVAGVPEPDARRPADEPRRDEGAPTDPACCTLGVDYTYDAVTREISWQGAVPRGHER